MVTVLPDQHKARFFGSSDLKRWEALSDFGPAGATGGVWECPDLFPLPVDGDPADIRWVLDVDINPGAIAGGSGGQYFVGTFDGRTFVNDNAPDRTLWVDYGKDFYATISFSESRRPTAGGSGWLDQQLALRQCRADHGLARRPISPSTVDAPPNAGWHPPPSVADRGADSTAGHSGARSRERQRPNLRVRRDRGRAFTRRLAAGWHSPLQRHRRGSHDWRDGGAARTVRQSGEVSRHAAPQGLSGPTQRPARGVMTR